MHDTSRPDDRSINPGRRVSRLVAALAIGVGAVAAIAGLGTVGAVSAGAASSALPTGALVALDSSGTITTYPAGSTGNVAPTTTTHTASTSAYQSDLDPSGNVWVVGSNPPALTEYTQAELGAGGTPNPAVSITGVSIGNPTSLAFDAAGDAWVGDGNKVVEFTPAQLATSGTPTPAVTLNSDTAGDLSNAIGLAFSPSGDLWVSNYNNLLASSLIEYTPKQLATSGTPTPNAIITSNSSNSLNRPEGITFDAAGDAWVTNYLANTLVKYSATQLLAAATPASGNPSSTSPTPTVTIGDDGTGSVNNPNAATFDATGNLWVANYHGGTASNYVEFTPAQLATTGTPTPVASLGGSATGITGAETLLFVPPTGYSLVASDGGIFNYGGSQFYGSTGSLTLNKPVVGMAESPTGKGYWLAAADGGIFNYGDASYYGSMGSQALNKPVVGIAATPDGKGYWLVASDGGIFSFGDATFYGSTGSLTLNKPIVGMAATPDGKGYWLVASDGGIFNYGDAGFYGSMGSQVLNKPVVGMSSTSDGQGYWMVASDGGVFALGDAAFEGSAGSLTLNKPIVGMAGPS
jgi:sugar lactone lactonase YvrE